MAKVEITAGARSVSIEDDKSSLTVVSRKALELWKATNDPQAPNLGFGSAGTHLERQPADASVEEAARAVRLGFASGGAAPGGVPQR